ncbi:MAG: hypothetical protein Q8891_09530 [Bacteroidota bacterium]|nr:hypothetical protein [Bacteroidota bacterium]
MKKITIILLLSIYTMSVVGYGVKGFYCCDNLKSVIISFSQDSHNHVSNSHDKSDCCKTKYQYFKVKDNHFAANHINSPVKLFTKANLFASSFQPVLQVNSKVIYANSYNAPPLHNGVPLHIYNCTFLI